MTQMWDSWWRVLLQVHLCQASFLFTLTVKQRQFIPCYCWQNWGSGRRNCSQVIQGIWPYSPEITYITPSFCSGQSFTPSGRVSRWPKCLAYWHHRPAFFSALSLLQLAVTSLKCIFTIGPSLFSKMQGCFIGPLPYIKLSVRSLFLQDG